MNKYWACLITFNALLAFILCILNLDKGLLNPYLSGFIGWGLAAFLAWGWVLK